jgi:prepilin-type N-terminal cleavage/methylation domain-containing protein
MNQKAFTLIELLVTIAIVGILAGFVAVQMNSAIDAANDARLKANLDSIKKAVIMYSVQNGEAYPIESTTCTIGSCSILDSAIQGYITADVDGTYTYESDGTGCTISTILSTGYSYQYDCSTLSYSTNTPISGVCGSSDGDNLSEIPSTNLCSVGTASVVSGEGPWTWDCAGFNGGVTDSCSTGGVPVSGSCGSSDGANLSEIPSTNLCDSGSASVVSGVGPWTWDCVGSNSGATDSCSTGGVPVNGSCGSSDGANLSEIPSTNLCNVGTASAVSGVGPWTWTCAGVNTGSDDSCSASFNTSCPITGVTGTLVCTASVASGNVLHTFTGVGSATWTAPANVAQVEYLVVGGGGGAGGVITNVGWGGGGGGGQVRNASNYSITSGSPYSVIVGGGGAVGSGGSGQSGSSSTFATITASGGGGGITPAAGGIGGTSGNGHIGGGTALCAGSLGFVYTSSGGGGDSENGQACTYGTGGRGGNGTTSSITGTSVYYGGGGSGFGTDSLCDVDGLGYNGRGGCGAGGYNSRSSIGGIVILRLISN